MYRRRGDVHNTHAVRADLLNIVTKISSMGALTSYDEAIGVLFCMNCSTGKVEEEDKKIYNSLHLGSRINSDVKILFCYLLYFIQCF